MRKQYLVIYSVLLFGSGAISAQAPRECTMTLTATASNSTVCYGDSTKLTATPSGGTAPYTYSWSPSTGLVCDTCKKTEAGVATNTTYTITVTDKTGCTATASVSVDVYPRIGIIAAYGDLYVCSGDSIQLSVGTSYGGTLPYTYSWTPDSLLSTPTVKNPYYLAGSSQTFTCKVTDQNGCSAKNSVHVVALSTPVFNASANLARFLAGDSMYATGGGGGPYTYTWSPSISLSTIMALPTSSTTYTLTVTGADGCSGSSTATYNPLTTTLLGCGSLFIAEYIQDTVHNNDAIELYNPTGSAINMDTYYLFGTTNGSLFSTPFYIRLHGTIRAHKTFLVVNTNAGTHLISYANMLSDSLDFGGSDIVALANMTVTSTSVNVTTLDAIGAVSPLPTDSGWAVGTGSTKNHTLVRKSTVTQGTLDWATCQTEWNVYSQGTFRYISKYQNVCTPQDPDLDLSFSNPTPSCGNPGYVNFSVEAQSTDPTAMFNSAVIDIQFTGGEFTGDSYSNGSVLVSEGSNFQSASGNDYSTFGVTDVSPGVIEITIGDPSGSSPNGTSISTDTLGLFNISLQIQNSCQTGSINFTNTSGGSATYTGANSTSTLTYYCGDISTPCYDPVADTCADGNPCSYSVVITSYDSTAAYDSPLTYSDSVTNITGCSINIASLSNPVYGNNSIAAGTNSKSIPANSSILTINGTGFGSTKGTINVSNANTGGTNMVPLDSTDILSWSENQISVKMPSYIINADTATPGSGPIQVLNNCDESASTPLQINYNIENIPNVALKKLRPNIVMDTVTESIKFRCDTSITNNGPALICVKKAIAEWNCYTGVNWKLVLPPIILDTSANDSISVIYFSNNVSTFPNAKTIMYTKPCYLPCYHSTDSVAFYDEVDIAIKRNQNLPGYIWDYDTTDALLPDTVLSFYDLITHELGHALGLGHINDSSSVMFYKALPGYRRVNILTGNTYPGPASLEGALDMVNTSAAYSPSYCNDSILIPSSRYCIDHTLSVPDISQNSYTLNLYPNPINDGDLTISYDLTQDSYIQFRILDCTGRIIMKLNDEHKTAGNYSEQVNIDALAGGVYLFTANINGECQTIKFIKL